MRLLHHSTGNGEAEGAARWCNEHGRTWIVMSWVNAEWGLDEVLGCGCQRYMATPCANGHLRVAGKIEEVWLPEEGKWITRWPCGCEE